MAPIGVATVGRRGTPPPHSDLDRSHHVICGKPLGMWQVVPDQMKEVSKIDIMKFLACQDCFNDNLDVPPILESWLRHL